MMNRMKWQESQHEARYFLLNSRLNRFRDQTLPYKAKSAFSQMPL
jgi:hypothetical protein